jgi:hypothetical protein
MVLTIRAVDLFKLGLKMQRDGVAQNSREFIEVALALHRELGLKPWHPDVFGLDPDTPISERLRLQSEIDQFCYVRDLRRQLAAMM